MKNKIINIFVGFGVLIVIYILNIGEITYNNNKECRE